MKKLIVISPLLGVLAGGLFLLMPQNVSKEMKSSPTPTLEQAKIAEVNSIDGKKSLRMRSTQESETLTSYTFLIADGDTVHILFTKAAKPHTFVLPSNSWSPDGNYVFLIDSSAFPKQVMVFNSSGDLFTDGTRYINVTDLFAKSWPQEVLDNATGWDSRGLLHITTKNKDKTKGPNFWFDVASKSFIQLAR